MAKATAVVEREAEVTNDDMAAPAAARADTGVRYEANIMGTGELGYSYHIKGTGFHTDIDADAFLRRQSESWEEQGVTVRSQDKKFGNGGTKPAAPAGGGNVFRPGARGGPGPTDDSCDSPGCDGQIAPWHKNDGSIVSGAVLKAGAHKRGQQKYCEDCFRAGVR